MLKNYIRTAFLNLWRHRGFSLINIFGLVVGITASFLIFLYVRFEKSYDGFNRKAETQIQNNTGNMQTADLGLYNVDFNYIRQYNIPVIAGREFSRGFHTDSAEAMILNETAVRAFGYNSPEQIIGKRFVQGSQAGTIIGVVKDFHFSSLKQKIDPLSIRIRGGVLPYISIRLRTSNLPETIGAIEKIWKQVIPSRPFNYFFLDEFFDRQYHSEAKFGSLFLNFAILAIFISCLGLFALASYITLQRTKEIGIRKIIGSSVSGIVVLLSKDFLKLVAISIIIASPIAWIAMNYWLRDFAYRIAISWWMIAAAGICALLIALLTVSFHAIKAAFANPVNSLRSE